MARCLFAGEQDAKELRAKDQQLRDLSWELKRKEAALTETADLLVLRKKGPSDLGMWYNTEHRYSGLNFLTPSQRHDELVEQIFDRRKQVYETAKAAHPARWSGDTRDWRLVSYNLYEKPGYLKDIRVPPKSPEFLAQNGSHNTIFTLRSVAEESDWSIFSLQ
ncbi:hypothetical protein [Cohnella boryungensis]|uniref:Uncharacterized protein n=1 Tax=Cohnella boryungensis TaxID=768479 RepID=A0ABV8SEP8_9BACL